LSRHRSHLAPLDRGRETKIRGLEHFRLAEIANLPVPGVVALGALTRSAIKQDVTTLDVAVEDIHVVELGEPLSLSSCDGDDCATRAQYSTSVLRLLLCGAHTPELVSVNGGKLGSFV
jgi:hypothetical protein